MQNTIFHTPIPPLRKLTLTAMLVAMGTALAVVSKYLFGNLPVRIDLAVCPMLTVAYVLGAWWCGGAYVMVDLLSCLFLYPPFLPITLCKCASGLLFGYMLHRGGLHLKSVGVACLLNALLIDILGMTYALYLMMETPFFPLLLTRIGGGVVNACINAAFCLLALPKLQKPMQHLLSKGN